MAVPITPAASQLIEDDLKASVYPGVLRLTGNCIGVNWGSTNLRAYLIDQEGAVVDVIERPSGVTKLDRSGIVAELNHIKKTWPKTDSTYLSGMIGSPSGWIDASYVQCQTGLQMVADQLISVEIGEHLVNIVPGLRCLNSWGDPDVMRGEEMEILGLVAFEPELKNKKTTVVLPGTHTKWASISSSEIREFFTSMSSEIFDHLLRAGLLSSVMKNNAEASASFIEGVERGAEDWAALGRLLFGVRAKVMTGILSTDQAASYARGILIGAEIADALRCMPTVREVDEILLLGNEDLCSLYDAAFKHFGIEARPVDTGRAIAAGYFSLHRVLLGATA